MWTYQLSADAEKDYKQLDGSQKKIVLAMLKKLENNPLPLSEGGYGHPLGNNKESGNLSNYLKVKARGVGIRIVYKLKKEDELSTVIVIGIREEKEVYKTAVKRMKKNKY